MSSIEQHTYIRLDAGLIVVTVDYRLAPEHPYPAAARDAIMAVDWVFTKLHHVNHNMVAVGGTGAGANLAIVATLAIQHPTTCLPSGPCPSRYVVREQRKIFFNLLLVPIIDNTT
jgi:acetyl esterase/lipase